MAYHLNRRAGPELIYWLRDKNINKAEVDFLVSSHDEIFPIEVKSQKGGKLKSLKVFAEEKSCFKSFKLSKDWFESEKLSLLKENTLELEVETWPLYAVEGLIRYLKKT